MDKWLVVIISWPIAYLMLKYRRAVKEFTGDIGFAEKVFGMGGTNTFIIIFAMLVFILSLMYALGTIQTVFQTVLGPFFGA